MNGILNNQRKLNIQKWLWFFLMFIGWITIILMWVKTYSNSETTYRETNGGKDWYEKLILPFYFTYISNLMGTILGTIMFFNLSKKIKFIRSFILITFINLLVTMVVFFCVLLPQNQPESAFGWIITLLAHLVMPLLMASVFLIVTLRKNIFNWKVNLYKKALIYLLFPIVWLIIAFIIYASLGMRASAAIYGFIKFKQQAWYVSIGWIVGIGLFYYLLSLLAIWLSMKKN